MISQFENELNEATIICSQKERYRFPFLITAGLTKTYLHQYRFQIRSIEQGSSSVELGQDTANRPHVNLNAKHQTKENLKI